MHVNYIQPNELAQDMPLGLSDDIFLFAQKINFHIDEIKKMLMKQWLVDIGTSTAHQDLDSGFNGVMLRGSRICSNL